MGEIEKGLKWNKHIKEVKKRNRFPSAIAIAATAAAAAVVVQFKPMYGFFHSRIPAEEEKIEQTSVSLPEALHI